MEIKVAARATGRLKTDEEPERCQLLPYYSASGFDPRERLLRLQLQSDKEGYIVGEYPETRLNDKGQGLEEELKEGYKRAMADDIIR